jgi:hypothetical protein
MFLKLMERGTEDFRLVEVSSVSFRRLEEPCVVYRETGSAEEKRAFLKGDAFVLNADGDTIEKFHLVPKLRKVGT